MAFLTIFNESAELPPGIADWERRAKERERRENARRKADRRRAVGMNSGDDGGWQSLVPNMTLKQLGVLATVISFAFTAGYNWNQIAGIETKMEAHFKEEAEIHSRLVTKETSDLQYKNLGDRLDEVINRLDDAISGKSNHRK